MKWLLAVFLSIALIYMVFALTGEARWRRMSAALTGRMQASPKAQAVGQFAFPEAPAALARYLERVLPPGAEPLVGATIRQQGSFCLDGRRWVPFTSQETVRISPPGFIWNARMPVFPGVAVFVQDAYVQGEGILEARLLGWIPVARQRGTRAMARGELLRFVAEAAWYPTALRQMTVREISADRVEVSVQDGDTHAALQYQFGADGLVAAVYAEDRERIVGDRVIPTPWEGRFWDYQRRDGFLVPLQGEVAWILPEGRQPYWRGQLVEITYQR